jgi:hypothetical protein
MRHLLTNFAIVIAAVAFVSTVGAFVMIWALCRAAAKPMAAPDETDVCDSTDD